VSGQTKPGRSKVKAKPFNLTYYVCPFVKHCIKGNLAEFWYGVVSFLEVNIGLCQCCRTVRKKKSSLVFGVLFGFQNIAPDMSRWTSKLGVMVLHLSKVYIDNMKCSRNQLNAYIAG